MIIKAPNIFRDDKMQSVFLAGAIEQGKATEWQDKVGQAVDREDLIVYNPRRDNWDASWEQSLENLNFFSQVDWELSHLIRADFKFFYFEPNTLCPITLMELGVVCGEMEWGPQHIYKASRTIVCCPEGFWRKGNVDFMCKMFRLQLVTSLDEAITRLQQIVALKEHLIKL